MPPVAEKPSQGAVVKHPNTPFLRQRPSFSSIKHSDVKAIARQVARRLSEREACSVIGLPLSTWTAYKAKHPEIVQYWFEQERSSQIIGHLDVIENAQSKDWRAADRLLALKDPTRFGKEQSSALPATSNAVDALLLNALTRVYGVTVNIEQGAGSIVSNAPAQLTVDTSPVDGNLVAPPPESKQ